MTVQTVAPGTESSTMQFGRHVGSVTAAELNQAWRWPSERTGTLAPNLSHRPIPGSTGAVPMTRDDDARPTGRTPSGWHDDARKRDAGHDEMQATVLRQWRFRSNPLMVTLLPDKQRAFYVQYVEAESPLLSIHGHLAGFADVAIWLTSRESEEERAERIARQQGDYQPRRLWVFMEVKPRIDSVGAIIRQCRATKLLAKAHGGDLVLHESSASGTTFRLSLPVHSKDLPF